MLMWRSIIENMGNETNSSYKGKAFWGDLCSIWLLMLKRNGTYFPLMSVPYDIMSYPLIKNHTSPIIENIGIKLINLCGQEFVG